MQNQTNITIQSGPEWRKMTARYAGRCIVCGHNIAAGDAIHWSSGYGAKHAACKYLTIEERIAAGSARSSHGHDAAHRRNIAQQQQAEYEDDLLSAQKASR